MLFFVFSLGGEGGEGVFFPSLITPGVFLLFYSTVCPVFSLSSAL